MHRRTLTILMLFIPMIALAALSANAQSPNGGQAAGHAPGDVAPQELFHRTFLVRYRDQGRQRTTNQLIVTAPADRWLVVTDIVVQGTAGFELYQRGSGVDPLFAALPPNDVESPTRVSYGFSMGLGIQPGHELYVTANDALLGSGESVVTLVGYRAAPVSDAPHQASQTDETLERLDRRLATLTERLSNLRERVGSIAERAEQAQNAQREQAQRAEQTHSELRQSVQSQSEQLRQRLEELSGRLQKLDAVNAQRAKAEEADRDSAKAAEAQANQRLKQVMQSTDQLRQQSQQAHQRLEQRLDQLETTLAQRLGVQQALERLTEAMRRLEQAKPANDAQPPREAPKKQADKKQADKSEGDAK